MIPQRKKKFVCTTTRAICDQCQQHQETKRAFHNLLIKVKIVFFTSSYATGSCIIALWRNLMELHLCLSAIIADKGADDMSYLEITTPWVEKIKTGHSGFVSFSPKLDSQGNLYVSHSSHEVKNCAVRRVVVQFISRPGQENVTFILFHRTSHCV